MMYELNGKIKSGLGEASFWVGKITHIFENKYGIKLFLGTLNVELEKEYVLDNNEKILPEEYGGEYDVLVKKCEMFGKTAYIVRPELNNKLGGTHPLNLIEIVSDLNFRKEYNLKDGDQVKICL